MTEFNVPDMSCGHCVGAITKAVQALDPQAQVRADLEAKRVSVVSMLPIETVLRLLDEAGYPATAID